MSEFQDPEVIARLLTGTRTWAVVGLSGDPARAAFGVAAFLQTIDKTVLPVHPSAENVLGQRVYRRLADIPGPVDVVDVFRRREAAGTVVDEAIAAGAGAVWLQLGVVDPAAARRARAAGLDVVMDTCPKIEWPHVRGQPFSAASCS